MSKFTKSEDGIERKTFALKIRLSKEEIKKLKYSVQGKDKNKAIRNALEITAFDAIELLLQRL